MGNGPGQGVCGQSTRCPPFYADPGDGPSEQGSGSSASACPRRSGRARVRNFRAGRGIHHFEENKALKTHSGCQDSWSTRRPAPYPPTPPDAIRFPGGRPSGPPFVPRTWPRGSPLRCGVSTSFAAGADTIRAFTGCGSQHWPSPQVWTSLAALPGDGGGASSLARQAPQTGATLGL